MTVCGLSSRCAERGFLFAAACGLLAALASLVWSTGSRAGGLSSCSTPAQELRFPGSRVPAQELRFPGSRVPAQELRFPGSRVSAQELWCVG